MPDPDLVRIPIDRIDDHALPRDRTALFAADMAELAASIRHSGLRQPVELIPLAEPRGPLTHALLSGYRRLGAWRRLAEDFPEEDWSAIPAFLRPAADTRAALGAIVEENEQRQALSPYERGAVLARAVETGLFDTHEAAARALHPFVDRHKRARLVALAETAEALGPQLTEPERLSQRQCLRLAAALRLGFEEPMRTALHQSEARDAESQWRLLEAYLHEAEATPRDLPPPPPGRPRRVWRATKRLVFRRERTREGWALHVTGSDATSDLCDAIFHEIERLFDPERE